MGKFNFKTEYKKNWFRTLLRTEDVEVTFIKKDGSERVMNCSLDPAKIPQVVQSVQEGLTKRKVSDTVLPVFDLDKQEWRSIRWESVKMIKFSLGTAIYDEDVV